MNTLKVCIFYISCSVLLTYGPTQKQIVQYLIHDVQSIELLLHYISLLNEEGFVTYYLFG